MADYTYTDLELVARELPGADQVEVGVDIDGAFFPLGAFKLQDFNISRAEAQQAAAEEAEASKSKSK
jgi:hypothetical protein